uniref:Uncharacterized protein n=1 Tax=Chlamydomonas euryale TaxID=1486919 RepID=A0A7R9YTJ0_9CHLO|mmetsp:Transcript_21379/g.64105  ORF Transcript_21379/g.64105 Transcript_21379/m.64105 type:complete len:188 (+) Transcript_21379:150-713(+)
MLGLLHLRRGGSREQRAADASQQPPMSGASGKLQQQQQQQHEQEKRPAAPVADGAAGLVRQPSLNDFSMGARHWCAEEEGACTPRAASNYGSDGAPGSPSAVISTPAKFLTELAGLCSPTMHSGTPGRITSFAGGFTVLGGGAAELEHAPGEDAAPASPLSRPRPQWTCSGLDMYDYASLARSSGPV